MTSAGHFDLSKKIGVKRVINASGPETALGTSSVDPEVVREVGKILSSFIDIDELQKRASQTIALATGAQAGCVTACAEAEMDLRKYIGAQGSAW